MNAFSLARRARPTGGLAVQRGATLIIALIMIVLITLVVLSAYTLSAGNLKSVGNMQMREETIAAANAAVEQLISTPFTAALATQTFTVDINNDGTDDYSVTLATPTCIRSAKATAAAPSDVELPASMSQGYNWNTDWDIPAMVNDAASGAAVTIHQGVRVLLTQQQKDTACP